MGRSNARRLKFIKEFDESKPDVFHEIYFDLSKKHFSPKKLGLNIGCWTGSYERLFEKGDYKIVSLDIEKRALLVAKEANPHALFAAGSIIKLPFKDNIFDTVSLFTVLEHLPEGTEEVSFAEIKRVLVNGGSLILTTPNDHWMGNIMDIAYWTVGHRHYKAEVLKDMLLGLGFKIRELKLKGRFFSNLSIPFFYAFKYLFKFNLYRNPLAGKVLKFEYRQTGYRDIFLVASKSKD